MKHLAPLAALLALLLVLAACGQGQPETPTAGNSPPGGTGSTNNGAHQPTVEISSRGLTDTSVSVAPGRNVAFANDPNGDEQRLCIGKNGTCDMNNTPGAPPELLSGGFLLQPGTSRLLSFNQEGTYHLTVANSGNMNVTISVHG